MRGRDTCNHAGIYIAESSDINNVHRNHYRPKLTISTRALVCQDNDLRGEIIVGTLLCLAKNMSVAQ